MSLHVIAITVIQLQYMQCIYIYIIDIYTYIQILYIYTHIYTYTHYCMYIILYIYINFQQLQSTPSLSQRLRAHLSHLRLEAHVQHPVGLRGFPTTGRVKWYRYWYVWLGIYMGNILPTTSPNIGTWICQGGGLIKKGIEHGCRTKIPVVKMVL